MESLPRISSGGIILGVGLAVLAIVATRLFRPARPDASSSRPDNQTPFSNDSSAKQVERRYFTLEELAAYDGTDGKPIFVAVLDEVYDVSAKKDLYGPGAGYHVFAGRDASRALAKMSFEPEDVNGSNLDDLDFMELETLQDWVTKFSVYNAYPNVGRVLRYRDLTRTQLRQFDGKQDPRHTILLGVRGKLYDVTLDGQRFYGPEGSYKQFAGRDTTRALACMLLTDDALDRPEIKELTPTQEKTLAQWEQKFEKYPVVGKLIEEEAT